jgi:hypothetical protein
MKNFILATIENEETNETKAMTFDSWSEYFRETFSPILRVLFVTDFEIKGATYKERKEYARDLAIDYSNNIASGLYWSDIATIQDKFYNIAKQYGLIKEFEENGII